MTIRHRLLHGDRGSILPLILGSILVVLAMIMALTASTSAFLAQRDLQSDCDDAATATGSEVNPDNPDTPGQNGSLQLDPEAAQEKVDQFRERFFGRDTSLTMTASVDRDVLVLRCKRHVTLPFGAFFGKGAGIDRTTESDVRSPVTDGP